MEDVVYSELFEMDIFYFPSLTDHLSALLQLSVSKMLLAKEFHCFI